MIHLEQIYNQIKPDTLTFWEGVFNVSAKSFMRDNICSPLY